MLEESSINSEIDKLKEKHFIKSIKFENDISNLKDRILTSNLKYSHGNFNNETIKVITKCLELIDSIIFPNNNCNILNNLKEFKNLVTFNIDEVNDMVNKIENQLNCKYNLNLQNNCLNNYKEILNMNIIKKKIIFEGIDSYINNNFSYEDIINNIKKSKILSEKILCISSDIIKYTKNNLDLNLEKKLNKSKINNNKIDLIFDYIVDNCYKNNLNIFNDFQLDNNDKYLNYGISYINQNLKKNNFKIRHLEQSNKNLDNELNKLKNKNLIINIGNTEFNKNADYTSFFKFINNLESEQLEKIIEFINNKNILIDDLLLFKLENYKIIFSYILINLRRYCFKNNISLCLNSFINLIKTDFEHISDYYFDGINEYNIKHINCSLNYNRKIKILNNIWDLKIKSNFNNVLDINDIYKTIDNNSEIRENIDIFLIENFENIISNLIKKISKKNIPYIFYYINENLTSKISNTKLNKLFLSFLYFIMPYYKPKFYNIKYKNIEISDTNKLFIKKLKKKIENKTDLLTLYFNLASYNLLNNKIKASLIKFMFEKIVKFKNKTNNDNWFYQFCNNIIFIWKKRLLSLNNINIYKFSLYLKSFFFYDNNCNINIDIDNYINLKNDDLYCIYYIKIILNNIKKSDLKSFNKLLYIYENNFNFELFINQLFNIENVKDLILNFKFELPLANNINNFINNINNYKIDLIISYEPYKFKKLFEKLNKNNNISIINKNIIFNILYYYKKYNKDISLEIFIKKHLIYYYRYNCDYFSKYLIYYKLKNLDSDIKENLIVEIEKLVKNNKKISINNIFKNLNFYEDDINLIEIFNKHLLDILKNNKKKLIKILNKEKSYDKILKILKPKLKYNMFYYEFNLYNNIKLEYNKLNFDNKKKFLRLIFNYLNSGKFDIIKSNLNLNVWKLYKNSKLIFSHINDDFRISIKKELKDIFIKSIDIRNDFNYKIFNLVEYFFEIFFETWMNNINKNKIKSNIIINLGGYWKNLNEKFKYFIIFLLKKYINKKVNIQFIEQQIWYLAKYYNLNNHIWVYLKQIFSKLKNELKYNNYELINVILNSDLTNKQEYLKISDVIENYLFTQCATGSHNIDDKKLCFNYNYYNEYILNEILNIINNKNNSILNNIIFKIILNKNDNKDLYNEIDTILNDLKVNNFLKNIFLNIISYYIKLNKNQKKILKLNLLFFEDLNLVIKYLYNVYIKDNKNKLNIYNLYFKILKENYELIYVYFKKGKKIKYKNLFLEEIIKFIEENLEIYLKRDFKLFINKFVWKFFSNYENNSNKTDKNLIWNNFIFEDNLIKILENNLHINSNDLNFNISWNNYEFFKEFWNLDLNNKIITIDNIRNNKYINLKNLKNEFIPFNLNFDLDYLNIVNENKNLNNEINTLKNQINIFDNYNTTLITEENINDKLLDNKDNLNIQINKLKNDLELKNNKILKLKDKIIKLKNDNKNMNNSFINNYEINKSDFYKKFNYELNKFFDDIDNFDINNINVSERDINNVKKLNNINELKIVHLDALKLNNIYKAFLDRVNFKYDELWLENNKNTEFIEKLCKKNDELFDEKQFLNTKLMNLKSKNSNLKYKNQDFKEEIEELNLSLKEKNIEISRSVNEFNDNFIKFIKNKDEYNKSVLEEINSRNKNNLLYKIEEKDDFDENSDIENNKSMNMLKKNKVDLDISDNMIENRKKRNSKNLNLLSSKLIDNYKNENILLKSKLREFDNEILNEVKDLYINFNKEFDNLLGFIENIEIVKWKIINWINDVNSSNNYDKTKLNHLISEVNKNNFNDFKDKISNKKLEIYNVFVKSMRDLNQKIYDLTWNISNIEKDIRNNLDNIINNI